MYDFFGSKCVDECKSREDLREAIDRNPKWLLALSDADIEDLYSASYLEELMEAPDLNEMLEVNIS